MGSIDSVGWIVATIALGFVGAMVATPLNVTYIDVVAKVGFGLIALNGPRALGRTGVEHETIARPFAAE